MIAVYCFCYKSNDWVLYKSTNKGLADIYTEQGFVVVYK